MGEGGDAALFNSVTNPELVSWTYEKTKKTGVFIVPWKHHEGGDTRSRLTELEKVPV